MTITIAAFVTELSTKEIIQSQFPYKITNEFRKGRIAC